MSLIDKILNSMSVMIETDAMFSLAAAFLGLLTSIASLFISIRRLRKKIDAEEQLEQMIARDSVRYDKFMNVLKEVRGGGVYTDEDLLPFYQKLDADLRTMLLSLREVERKQLSEALYQKSMSGRFRYLDKILKDVIKKREVA